MANWATLKSSIADAITTNGNQEITGALLQQVLNNIVNSIGENATFAGVATPATNPGIPDGPVFYVATTKGSYPNFGVVVENKVAIFYNADAQWEKIDLEIPLFDNINQEIIDITNAIQQLQDNTEDLPSIREQLGTLVVNDLTTGGADKALSAEMGKMLGMSVEELEERVHDLGDFGRSSQAEAEAGKADIAGNPGIVLIRYTVGNKNGIILQQVGETITNQILFWDSVYQRHINFSSSDKTSVSSTSYWYKIGATHTSYDAETRRLHLRDMNYSNLNPSIDAVLPLASETEAGLMSKEQVTALENKQERLGVGDGISLKDNIVSVIIGLGLAFNGREIVVNYDPSFLTFTSDNKLSVNIGKGLHINPDNQLGVNVGDGLEINHSDKTVQLAQTVRDKIAELNRRIQALEAQI